jgi:hypothetical protein
MPACQHTASYVSTRAFGSLFQEGTEKTSAYVGIRACGSLFEERVELQLLLLRGPLRNGGVAHVRGSVLKLRLIRCQHTSAYVSIRQHTSAYVSIRQHTSA